MSNIFSNTVRRVLNFLFQALSRGGTTHSHEGTLMYRVISHGPPGQSSKLLIGYPAFHGQVDLICVSQEVGAGVKRILGQAVQGLRIYGVPDYITALVLV